MKIQVELISNSSREDIFDLKNYMESEGIAVDLLYDNEHGKLGGDYQSILEIVAQSATLVAIINGLFSCVKNYMLIKSNDRKSDNEKDMIKISYKEGENSIDVVVNKDNISEIGGLLNKFVVDTDNRIKNND